MRFNYNVITGMVSWSRASPSMAACASPFGPQDSRSPFSLNTRSFIGYAKTTSTTRSVAIQIRSYKPFSFCGNNGPHSE